MELKTRTSAILKETLENQKTLFIDNILKKYGITQRMLYYDLKQINEWLTTNCFGEAKIANQKLYLITTKDEKIENLLSKSKYYFSVNEREALELLLISLSNDLINLTFLKNFFDVSRNTISIDIKNLKDKLSKEKITLLSTQKNGYIIQGEEFALRKYLSNILSNLTTRYARNELIDYLQKSLACLVGAKFDFLEISRCLIKQYEIDINSQLYTEHIQHECIMILISWIRGLNGNYYYVGDDEKDTLKLTKSYVSIVKNSEKLKKYNINIPDNEAYYITSLLLGIRISEFSSQEQETYFIYKFVDELIHNFELVSCINIEDKEHLAIRLRSHIRPFYYRLKYGLQEDNILTSQVQHLYPEVFFLTKMAISNIDNKISKIISDDEIAYITIYLVSSINDGLSILGSPLSAGEQINILVINFKNRVVGSLIVEQLKEQLGNTIQYEIISKANLNKVNWDKYALIITNGIITDISKDLKKKILTVNSLSLSEEDFECIGSALSDQGISISDNCLIKLILNNVRDNVKQPFNEKKLYLDIFRTVRNFRDSNLGINQLDNLNNLLKHKVIRRLSNDSWINVITEGYLGIFGEQKTLDILSNEENIQRQKQNVFQMKENVVIVSCKEVEKSFEKPICIVASKQKVAITSKIMGNIFLFISSNNSSRYFPMIVELYHFFLNQDKLQIKHIIEGE